MSVVVLLVIVVVGLLLRGRPGLLVVLLLLGLGARFFAGRLRAGHLAGHLARRLLETLRFRLRRRPRGIAAGHLDMCLLRLSRLEALRLGSRLLHALRLCTLRFVAYRGRCRRCRHGVGLLRLAGCERLPTRRIGAGT